MKPYQRVFKLLSESLVTLGFERRGSSWWQKRDGRVWQRVHVHKFSHGDCFRVHAAIHAVGFEDEAPWLNGPMSYDGWFEETKLGRVVRRYEFRFVDTEKSLSRCAAELRDYIEHCVEPWFGAWREERMLIDSLDSPLTSEAKAFLRKKPNKAPEPTTTAVTPRAP